MSAPSTQPRVVFVSSHARVGGSESYLVHLIDVLGGRIRPTVVLLEDGPVRAQFEAAGVEPVVIATGTKLGLLTGAVRLRRALRQRPVDVIHANGVKAALVTTLALGRRRFPIVWAKHDHSWDGGLARWVASRVDLVVAVSESVASSVRSRARVVVVPPGLSVADQDDALGRTRLRSLAGAAEADIVVVCVGRLDVAKGHDNAIDALAMIRKLAPVRLVIVGGPDPKQPNLQRELEARAASHGVADAVTFAGSRPDAHLLIAGASALLVTSRAVDRRGMGREGFGLVAAEALRLGTPVVGFADGAIPEVVGECGVLVPPGDIAALAEATVSVVTDPDRSRELADCGRARASRFDPEAWGVAMLGAYADVAPKLKR